MFKKNTFVLFNKRFVLKNTYTLIRINGINVYFSKFIETQQKSYSSNLLLLEMVDQFVLILSRLAIAKSMGQSFTSKSYKIIIFFVFFFVYKRIIFIKEK